jgi:hypothetical protein
VLSGLSRWPLRRALSVGVAVLCVIAVVPAAARAALDQSQTAPFDGGATIYGLSPEAQTFTAGIDGRLYQVDLLLFRRGDPGDLTVEVRALSGGVPSTVLASATVPQNNVLLAPGGWVSVALSPSAPSSVGTEYAIVLSAPNADPDMGSEHDWLGSRGDPYPRGQALGTLDGGATWFVQGTFDQAFKTYVAPATNRPPDCSGVSASPGTLSPATRDRFTTITLSGASDPDGDPLSFHVDSVTQDEPVSGAADDTSPDAQLVGGSADSNQVRVRAERNPMGNGRVHRITYTVSDGNGGSCSGVAKVAVPRKKGQPAVDDGDTATWDSFTGARLTP